MISTRGSDDFVTPREDAVGEGLANSTRASCDEPTYLRHLWLAKHCVLVVQMRFTTLYNEKLTNR